MGKASEAVRRIESKVRKAELGRINMIYWLAVCPDVEAAHPR